MLKVQATLSLSHPTSTGFFTQTSLQWSLQQKVMAGPTVHQHYTNTDLALLHTLQSSEEELILLQVVNLQYFFKLTPTQLFHCCFSC